MTWGELIKKTRRELEVTRKEFACILGTTTNGLSQWEYTGVTPGNVLVIDIVYRVFINSGVGRDLIKKNKERYMSYRPDHGDEKESFLDYALEGNKVVGLVTLWGDICAEKDDNLEY